MNQPKQAETNKRIIKAPPPSDPVIPASIYYLEVRQDCDVEWKWTIFPDGNRVVTGYYLIEKKTTKITEIVQQT
ncbi:MAG: hypothetical protein SAJ37_22705 [Oscillatoria sp. PMC 1068.18]|nr:hypothetical protein [Oscillatoria sp. PMC 1076.18]MEC4991556.1 hypothetical protein [Oscillatoria sp. PMC 1068.18]